jgi:5'-methylthioinosine phosphorylase
VSVDSRLALAGGDYMRDLGLASGEAVEIHTGSGPVALIDCGPFVLLYRHGLTGYLAPDRIDHQANLSAVVEAGCDRVLGIGSVGGLRAELNPGTFVAPDDFIALHVGISTFEDERGHRIPGFDSEWRLRVLRAWSGSTSVPIRAGGVYWQAIGPRFETPAEIRLIAPHADVVGMTIASECVIAGELGLRYAAICLVDNLANGVGDTKLTVEELEAGRAANRGLLAEALGAVLPELAGEHA